MKLYLYFCVACIIVPISISLDMETVIRLMFFFGSYATVTVFYDTIKERKP